VPRNAADIAWSEYNHQWAGFFVLAIALLALLAQAGLRPARHWPLLFLGLALFLFIRSDAESWPLGSISLLDSIRDVETLQHRLVVLLLIAFGIFEWRVRATAQRTGWQPLVFPIGCGLGGLLLLTHTHQLANVKEELLIELTHAPLAIAGIAAGAARYLELKLAPPASRIAGWIWPLCFLFVAALLIFYREA
jgi:putative copper resistance protein D